MNIISILSLLTLLVIGSNAFITTNYDATQVLSGTVIRNIIDSSNNTYFDVLPNYTSITKILGTGNNTFSFKIYNGGSDCTNVASFTVITELCDNYEIVGLCCGYYATINGTITSNSSTSNGTLFYSLINKVYNHSLQLIDIEPSSYGPVYGGNNVILSGFGIENINTINYIQFGKNNGTNITKIISNCSYPVINVIVPAHNKEESVNIIISYRNINSTNSINLVDTILTLPFNYTYFNIARIRSLDQEFCIKEGGCLINVTGQNFQFINSIKLDNITVLNLTINSNNSLSFIVPAVPSIRISSLILNYSINEIEYITTLDSIFAYGIGNIMSNNTGEDSGIIWYMGSDTVYLISLNRTNGQWNEFPDMPNTLPIDNNYLPANWSRSLIPVGSWYVPSIYEINHLNCNILEYINSNPTNYINFIPIPKNTAHWTSTNLVMLDGNPNAFYVWNDKSLLASSMNSNREVRAIRAIKVIF